MKCPRRAETGDIEDDATFCSVLDSQVMCCTTCDWWVEAGEVDEAGACSDCQQDEG